MASLANVYRCIDDYTAGTTPSPYSGASGQPVSADFTAPTAAAAQQVAFILASALQRPVRLVNVGGGPPYTYTTSGSLPTVAITSCPSGVGY